MIRSVVSTLFMNNICIITYKLFVEFKKNVFGYIYIRLIIDYVLDNVWINVSAGGDIISIIFGKEK